MLLLPAAAAAAPRRARQWPLLLRATGAGSNYWRCAMSREYNGRRFVRRAACWDTAGRLPGSYRVARR